MNETSPDEKVNPSDTSDHEENIEIHEIDKSEERTEDKEADLTQLSDDNKNNLESDDIWNSYRSTESLNHEPEDQSDNRGPNQPSEHNNEKEHNGKRDHDEIKEHEVEQKVEIKGKVFDKLENKYIKDFWETLSNLKNEQINVSQEENKYVKLFWENLDDPFFY